jgi:dipeptidyl aminopeptidase/acylaminoacyl peptidase
MQNQPRQPIRFARFICGICFWFLIMSARAQAQQSFTLEQVMSAPFPSNLTAAKSAPRVAWVLDEQGKRNIYVAEAPDFKTRRLTAYLEEDGLELSSLQFSADANTIVYTRGEGKNRAGQSPNPTSNPAGAEEAVFQISWRGGDPQKIDAGHDPQISSKGICAYVRDGELWLAPLDGKEKPEHLVVRGTNSGQRWAPDGTKLAFVSGRGDHGFIGIYDLNSKTVRFVAPSVDSDSNVEWSLDAKQIAFVRRPAVPRDTPEGYFIEPDRPHPWAIWVAEVATWNAKEIWHSGKELQDSFPYMAGDTGGGVSNWAAGGRIIFASEQDGWQHLYALFADGSGAPKLLTPGNCEVEQWSLSADRKTVFFNSNCDDIDRRHLWSVSASGDVPQQLSNGSGIEWSPAGVTTTDTFVYLASDAQHSARPFVRRVADSRAAARPLAAETWPDSFPASKLIAPQQVIFKSADGLDIHGQLFLPKDVRPGEKRPAVLFFHGGPMRQMLLGWHYMYYYSNSYAMNQYLASRGYVVLSVNYRSGIGYGRAFREAPGRAGRGASEYQDVVTAAKYLQSRADVNPARIGLWGGSYGGYLTALGLARNSDLFAAGVDVHGVHDWPTDNWEGKNISPELTKLAHDSSPITSVDTWKSPVLLIHGDDDRNVYFTQTVDLVARLRERNVHIEQLIFPDEIHDFLLHRSWLKAYHAASDFFDRTLTAQPAP